MRGKRGPSDGGQDGAGPTGHRARGSSAARRREVEIELRLGFAVVRDGRAVGLVRRALTAVGRGYDATAPRWVPREDHVRVDAHDGYGLYVPTRDQAPGPLLDQVGFARRLVPHVADQLREAGYEPACRGHLPAGVAADADALAAAHPLVRAAVVSALEPIPGPSLVSLPSGL